MGLIVAGERSGVGKTTVTLALLAAIAQRRQSIQAFKVGPDYIDPMFHQAVTGRPSFNLDPVLTSEAYVCQCYQQQGHGADFCLIEGVMGLFDGAASGASATDAWGSTAHIARLLDVPVLLVLDCSRLSGSVAAIAHGFRTLDPQINLVGVVLNRVASDRHLELLQAALAAIHLPILGVLRRHKAIALPDRHLGLVPTAELQDFAHIVAQLAELGRTCFDWSQLTPLLQAHPMQVHPTAPVPHHSRPAAVELPNLRPRIAVARDRAFSFYYADNLTTLERLGAELIPWSPLDEVALPPGTRGLYFGGGFPEVFADALSDNQPGREAVRAAIAAGLPTYAECGGLMYLCHSLTDFEGKSWAMAGSLATDAIMGDRLVLGYRRAIAQQDTPLVNSGAEVWGHEFHRSHLSHSPPAPLYETRGYHPQSPINSEGWASHNVHASYIHLQWGHRIELPEKLVNACSKP
ncbi:MAG: cobyrinate a,c-diamide synthase [Cyanobacteria bacterium J06639_16]